MRVVCPLISQFSERSQIMIQTRASHNFEILIKFTTDIDILD